MDQHEVVLCHLLEHRRAAFFIWYRCIVVSRNLILFVDVLVAATGSEGLFVGFCFQDWLAVEEV